MSGDAFSGDLETSNFKIFSGKRNHGALAWKRWRGDGGGKRGWRREGEERNDERERERITEGEGGGSKGGKMEGTGKVRGGGRD